MGRRAVAVVLWLSLDDLGEVRYSFVDVMAAMAPYYMLRLVGGRLFLCGRGAHGREPRADLRGRRTVAVAPPPAHAAEGAA